MMSGLDYTDSQVPNFLERIADISATIGLERPTNPVVLNSGRPKTQAPVTRKIPTTVDEFMEMEGLSEWPQHVTSEHPIEHEPWSVIGSQDEIREELKSAAPLEDQLAGLDALEERTRNLELIIKQYTDHILTDEIRFSRIKNGFFYSNSDKLFLTDQAPLGEAGSDDPTADKPTSGKLVDSGTGKVANELKEKKKNDVNFTKYPGFRRKELTELPNQLEAPQLMHRVTKAQDFNAGHPSSIGFSKFWKKIFLSDASVAVVHDLFWWCFLRIFKPKTEKQQDKIFDRLADSFAALFYSVHTDIQDKIFKVYPDVLAQCIYVIFHEAFAESHRMFGPLFMEELVGYCWELITGTKPSPDTWHRWNMDVLQQGGKGRKGNALDGKDSRLQYDFDSLYNTISRMQCNSEGNLLDIPDKDSSKPKPKLKKAPESCLAGSGPDFEKVLFNLAGLSPLIAHFLHMKHLRDIQETGRKVRRTEITGQATGEQTYNDIVVKRKAASKTNRAAYQKLCRETDDEINRIERRKLAVSKEIDRMKDNIGVFKHTGYDIRFLTDRMISKLEEEMESDKRAHVPMNLASEVGQPNVDRESDSDGDDEEVRQQIEDEYQHMAGTVERSGTKVMNVIPTRGSSTPPHQQRQLQKESNAARPKRRLFETPSHRLSEPPN